MYKGQVSAPDRREGYRWVAKVDNVFGWMSCVQGGSMESVTEMVK